MRRNLFKTWRERYPALVKSLVSDEPSSRSAVYFLLLADEVAYIGASQEPGYRVYCHSIGRRIEFDAVLYLPCNGKDEALKLEEKWIALIRPPHNRRANPDYKTRKILLAKDLANMLKVIEVAERVKRRKFRAPDYLDSILREAIERDYEQARAVIAKVTV